MDRKRALVYPYDSESAFLIRFNHLNKAFDSIGAVSPRGWGLVGKDAGAADGGDELGFKVVKDFEEYNDKDYDAVALVDSFKELDFEKIVYPKLELLASKGKDIISLKRIESSHLKLLEELCSNNNVSFRHFVDEKKPDMPQFTNILDMDVPVIFVLGLGDRTQKFNIQLSLWEGLKSLGYNVSQIGSKNYGNIFGFHSFPDFMLNNDIAEQDKVILFNRMVKRIEINEKPDVIIIGIPGGIMAINKDIAQGFGIIPYMISQAVKADASILSIYYEEYNEDFFKEIELLARYRFRTPIDCFNLSNIKIDYAEVEQSRQMSYLMVDRAFIDNKKNKYEGANKAFFNILNENDQRNMAQYIVNVLSGEEAIEDVL
ncbi:TIGR04066 family peptide maturation system protein [Lutispora sp.]|uniref:TIGR04066 family peptide maturation system protein n=1 Tax=Lutispora sp. TaxID=2828727 RepID=UPI002B1FB67B|nr:TIGR04066 family peptide maturation system protein [Lutispora sp.]MEA4964158.1 TIGR04066 family peptide maturation system protein [Lutispora sp.]